MNNAYPMAYTEVLTIINYYLNEEDYNKIPKEKIEFFEKNADNNYKYRIDKSKPYAEQKISKIANSIIVSLYREYFVNEEEKRILDQILFLNELKQKQILAYEEELNKKDNLELTKEEDNNLKVTETALVKLEKESLWQKIINSIKRRFKQ